MAARKKHRAETKRRHVLRHVPLTPLVLLALLVLALFAPSLQSGYAYDSTEQIDNGEFIHDRENLLPSLTFRIMAFDVLDFNRPVALTSLILDAVVWDHNPFGYHLTNILLHLAASLLVFVLARHLLALRDSGIDPPGRDLAAFLAAALFAVHPLVTEAVCEPSNRKDLLALVFGLAAILVAARHDPAARRADALRLLLIGLLSLLSVGSKEAGVAFPAVLLLYWILFRRDEPRAFWFRALAASALPVLAFVLARFVLEHRVSAVFVDKPSYPGGSFLNVLFDQPRIYLLYLVNAVWPTQLCADYGLYSVRYMPFALALPVLLLLGAAFAWWARREPRALFGAGLMVLGVLPASNLLPQYHPAADRYLYIPLAGAALLLAVGLDRLPLFRRTKRRWIPVAVLLVAGVLLGWGTVVREAVWASPLALAEDTMKKNPQSDMAWSALPEDLLEANRPAEARLWYERAQHTPVQTRPWLWAGYALCLDQLGDHAQALAAARHALALKPDIADADKMILTMQCDRDFAHKFARLVATDSTRP
jgi:tetratricopeptide (TPR) repeat protein